MAAAAAVAALTAASPATAAAQQDPYSDVTEGVHKPSIDALAERGLFEGTLCGADAFCPSESIKRSTMAVWLIRAIETEEPTAIDASRFADVDSSDWRAAYIDRLAVLEITVGCTQQPLNYCPTRLVTRSQMATFLVRAFDLQPAGPAGFIDTSGSVHAANIDALASARITVGCSQDPLRYCPSRSVTRAQMATFLARALGIVETPRPTLSERIAYAAYNRDTGQFGLWVEDADGISRRQLADNHTPGDEPLWSPDGQRIAYAVYDRDADQNELWVEDADGKNKRQLASNKRRLADNTPEILPSWSPDGQRIIYEVRDFYEVRGGFQLVNGLWIVDADGNNRRRIADYGFLLDWSPDGQRISWTGGVETRGLTLWVADGDGSNRRQLADNYSRRYRPTWSPDGQRITYLVEDEHDNERLALWVVDADGSNKRELADNGWGPKWSPYGQRITYLVPRTPFYLGSALWVVDADGSNKRQLLDKGDGSWSPDGQRIIYGVRDVANSRYGTWVEDADGSNKRQLADNGYLLQLSPDGQRIIYVVRRDIEGQATWTVDINGDNRRHLADYYPHDPQWSPDGQHFSFAGFETPNVSSIWVAGVEGSTIRLLGYNGSVFWSPDGQRIAYMACGDAKCETFAHHVEDVDGTNRRQLTDPTSFSYYQDMKWSPDGQHIAYTVCGDASCDGGALYVADADGNGRQLADDANDYSWSPS